MCNRARGTSPSLPHRTIDRVPPFREPVLLLLLLSVNYHPSAEYFPPTLRNALSLPLFVSLGYRREDRAAPRALCQRFWHESSSTRVLFRGLCLVRDFETLRRREPRARVMSPLWHRDETTSYTKTTRATLGDNQRREIDQQPHSRVFRTFATKEETARTSVYHAKITFARSINFTHEPRPWLRSDQATFEILFRTTCRRFTEAAVSRARHRRLLSPFRGESFFDSFRIETFESEYFQENISNSGRGVRMFRSTEVVRLARRKTVVFSSKGEAVACTQLETTATFLLWSVQWTKLVPFSLPLRFSCSHIVM